MRLRVLWVVASGVMVLLGTVGYSAAAAAPSTATVALTINPDGVTSPGVL